MTTPIDLTLKANHNTCFEEWIKLPVEERVEVGITGSYDMGWQKRRSGNKYDSLSGHAFLIGQQSKKIICQSLYCKACHVCLIAKGKNIPARPHDYPINFADAPKAMEATAVLQVCHDLYYSYDGKVFLEYVVSDDDSTMRAKLKHPKMNKRTGKELATNTGKLRKEIKEPK